MAWAPDTLAGFALAALLSDDRDLARVAQAVAQDVLPALRTRLDVLPSPPGAHSELGSRAEPYASALGQDRESGVRALLALLKPELDGAALSLPARMRGLLARLAPLPLQKQLRSDTLPTRPDFHLDEELLGALSRIARAVQERETP